MNDVIIKTLVTGPVEVNTYIVSGREKGKCFIVDPSDTAMVKAYLSENELVCTHVLLTHGHFDHILSVAELQSEYGANVVIQECDMRALTNGKINLGAAMGIKVNKCKADTVFADNIGLTAAGFSVRGVHTPGHSAGSACYILEEEKLIFTGDTLFNMSVGRTDLPGGDSNAIKESILYRLFSLKGDYRLLPGHMEESTLDYERMNNPYMKGFM